MAWARPQDPIATVFCSYCLTTLPAGRPAPLAEAGAPRLLQCRASASCSLRSIGRGAPDPSRRPSPSLWQELTGALTPVACRPRAKSMEPPCLLLIPATPAIERFASKPSLPCSSPSLNPSRRRRATAGAPAGSPHPSSVSFSFFSFPCSLSESSSPSFLQVTAVTAFVELPCTSLSSFRARSGRGPLDLAASAMIPSVPGHRCPRRRPPASPAAAPASSRQRQTSATTASAAALLPLTAAAQGPARAPPPPTASSPLNRAIAHGFGFVPEL